MSKSMGMNLASGLQGMLKDGHNSYEGVDEAIMRNINAAKELAAIVRTSLGPNGELRRMLESRWDERTVEVARLMTLIPFGISYRHSRTHSKPRKRTETERTHTSIFSPDR